MTTLPASISDWAVVPNVALTSSVDQVVQYRQIMFAAHTWMLAMGATVILSSNGTTASAADNVASTADIVYAAAGTAHTWIAYSLQGEYFTLECNNAAADTTPQAMGLFLSGSAYTGGTTANRATASVLGTETTTNASRNIIGWASPGAGYISYGYSASAGIGWFIVKAAGTASVSSMTVIDRPAATDSMRDNGPGSYCVVATTWSTTAFSGTMSTLTADRLTNTASSMGASWIWNFSAIPSGQFANSLGVVSPLYVGTNSSISAAARMFGTSRILAGVPTTAPWNGRSPTDPVLDPFTWWTVTPFAVLWPKSAGDIL